MEGRGTIRRAIRGIAWLLWGLLCYQIAHSYLYAIGPVHAVGLWLGLMSAPRFLPLLIRQLAEALRKNW